MAAPCKGELFLLAAEAAALPPSLGLAETHWRPLTRWGAAGRVWLEVATTPLAVAVRGGIGARPVEVGAGIALSQLRRTFLLLPRRPGRECCFLALACEGAASEAAGGG